MAISEPRVPLTHQVPGPTFAHLVERSLLEVKEGEGFFLAELLDFRSDGDLQVRFTNPRFTQEPFWTKRARVRPQPPVTICEDIEYDDEDVLDFFHSASEGWYQGRILSANHPFYYVNSALGELIVHISQTRPCNSLSVDPMLAGLFHHEEAIPVSLAKVWERTPDDLQQIRRDSGALQVRFDDADKIVVLGNHEAITRAKLLIDVAFEHFAQIYKQQLQERMPTPPPPPPCGSLAEAHQAPISELTMEQRAHFDDQDTYLSIYKAEFLLPQSLKSYSFGKDEIKRKKLQQQDSKLYIAYKQLAALNQTKEEEKDEPHLLVTILGIDCDSVQHAANQLNITTTVVPVEKRVIGLLASKLEHIKQRSKIDWWDWGQDYTEGGEVYSNLKLIGMKERLEAAKLLIQRECEPRDDMYRSAGDYYERPGSSQSRGGAGGGGGGGYYSRDLWGGPGGGSRYKGGHGPGSRKNSGYMKRGGGRGGAGGGGGGSTYQKSMMYKKKEW